MKNLASRFGPSYLQRVERALLYATAGGRSLHHLRAAGISAWQRRQSSDAQVFAGWESWERAIVAFISPPDRVLVAGCGTGRDLLALAAMGCRAAGVDPVPDAIATARRIIREQQLDIPVHVGFIDEAAIDGEYDVVSFSGMCYGYIPERARRAATLRKAAALLAPSGRILMSYVRCDEHAWRRSVAVGRLAGRVCRADWRLEPGDVLTIDVETGAPFYEHWFTPGELDAEAAEAGLRIVFRGADPIPFAVAVPTRQSAG
jgi:SAM-dependent methyltransferase